MKGAEHQGTMMKGTMPRMDSPSKVMSAKDLHGQCGKCTSTKTSAEGGFTASRKKGSVKGS